MHCRAMNKGRSFARAVGVAVLRRPQCRPTQHRETCACPRLLVPVQILGTFISALVFGLATYFLVLVGIVRRSHLGGSPFIECLAYGRHRWLRLPGRLCS